MIILSRGGAVLAIAYGIAAVLTIGLTAVFVPGDSPKQEVENLVLAGVVVSAVGFLVWIVLSARSRQRKRRIQRLLAAGPLSPPAVKEWTLLLGDLGRDFFSYNRDLLEISDRRAEKILGMHGLIRSLFKNSQEAWAAAAGGVSLVYFTPQFAEAIGETGLLPGTPLSQVLRGYRPERTIAQLERSRSVVRVEAGGREISCFGIADSRGQIAYVLLSLGGKALAAPEVESGGAVPERQVELGLFSRLRRGFNRFVGREGQE